MRQTCGINPQVISNFLKRYKTMEMHNIEQLTKNFKAAYDELSDRTLELQADVDAAKMKRLRGIKNALAKVAGCQAELHAAIANNPSLFKKPRSTAFYGVRVGFKKGSGKVEFKNQKRVIELIKKLLPEQAETLIKTEEKPLRAALSNLPADILKKLGCTVVGTGDQVLIKVAESDIDKMLEALLKDWNDETIAEQAA